MRKVYKLLALILVVVFFALQISAASGDTTVYVTNTGEKYHTYGCQYLRKSCNPISLENAVYYGYTRCSRCSPPYLDSTLEPVPAPSPPSSSVSNSGSTGSSNFHEEYVQEKENLAQVDYEKKLEEKDKAISSLKEKNKKLQSELTSAQKSLSAYTADLDEKELEIATLKNKNAEEIFRYSAITACVSILFSCAITSCLKKQKINELESEVSNIRRDYNRLKTQTEKRNQYIQQFKGKTCRELANVPPGVVFDANYWPTTINGTNLIVYLSLNGKKYHTGKCRYASQTSARNIYRLPQDCEPCKLCHPPTVTGQPQWIIAYQSYIKTKKEFDIPDPDIR